MRTAHALAALLVVGACSADRPSTSSKPDASMGGDSVDKPSIDPATPTSTPNGTVAIRGSTNGAKIVVKGGPGDPVVKAALPTGGFCVDAPLEPSGPTTLEVYALKDGVISAASTLTVTQDAAAPIPQDAMCLGMEQPVCVPEDNGHADCSNSKDDDCNGLTDMCDPGCNGCIDDALEPNNQPFFVPMVAAGTYQLQLCPCTDDYFAFQVGAGGVVHVKATFNQANVDIDMVLQTPAQSEQNAKENVAISQTVTSTEEITYTSTAGGMYYLKIYPYDTAKSGAYTLTIY